MSINLSQTGLNPTNPHDKALMKSVQGNILRSHGFRLSTCLFGKFLPEESRHMRLYEGAKLFSELLKQRLSSEWEVYVRRKDEIGIQDENIEQPCFVGCYLSR